MKNFQTTAYQVKLQRLLQLGKRFQGHIGFSAQKARSKRIRVGLAGVRQGIRADEDLAQVDEVGQIAQVEHPQMQTATTLSEINSLTLCIPTQYR